MEEPTETIALPGSCVSLWFVRFFQDPAVLPHLPGLAHLTISQFRISGKLMGVQICTSMQQNELFVRIRGFAGIPVAGLAIVRFFFFAACAPVRIFFFVACASV